MSFYLCIHSFSLVQNFIRIRSFSFQYKYMENKYRKKLLLMPVVLKLFIVCKTWSVSSKCRSPALSPEGPIQQIGLGPRNLHFEQVSWVILSSWSRDHSLMNIPLCWFFQTLKKHTYETNKWDSMGKTGWLTSPWLSTPCHTPSVHSILSLSHLRVPLPTMKITI